MKPAGVRADIHDLVIALGGDQQADRNDHQHQGRAIEIACIKREAAEALPKDAAELESQQDLGPENQHSGFVERGFDEFRQLHRRMAISIAKRFPTC
jgi:hypothetical protein